MAIDLEHPTSAGPGALPADRCVAGRAGTDREGSDRQGSPAPFLSLGEHLAFELEILTLRLRRQVSRLRARHRLRDDPFAGLCVRDEEVDRILSPAPEPDLDPDLHEARETVEEQSAAIADLLADRAGRLAATRAAGLEPPLFDLAARFGLSSTETQLVGIALAPEIDLAFETLYGYVQNDVTRRRPTVALALELLSPEEGEPLALRALLAPDAPLRRRHLLRLVEDPQDRDPPMAARSLRLEDRIVDHLLGGAALEEGLIDLCRVVALPAGASWRAHPRSGGARSGHRAGLDTLPLAEEVRRQLRSGVQAIAAGGVLALAGQRHGREAEVAAALAAETGRPLLCLDGAAAVRGPEPVATTLARVAREARLRGACLWIEGFDAFVAEEAADVALAALERQLTELDLPVLVGLSGDWDPAERLLDLPGHRVVLAPPAEDVRAALWRREIRAAGVPEPSPAELAAVAERFELTPREIRAAAGRALIEAHARGGAAARPTAHDLAAGARVVGRATLGKLAQKITCPYDWDDLVLPHRSLQGLRDLHASIEQRRRVHHDWGFGARLGLGRGTAVLFAGPSGTGKTMAAGILARALGLDGYRVDLAGVVSKYIGETEKNLARVFEEAERSNAVLFFDEADALFGKRSEVRDSHDRHANIEVAYLLQRLESSSAVVILATNFKANLDDAFARRLGHAIDFPAPDRELRERLWRRMLPPEAPLAGDVDLEFLARQFELAGGAIKNVALTSAFLAAQEGGEEIGMRHLVLATARELQKMGRLPTKSDFRDYYEWIRERSP